MMLQVILVVLSILSQGFSQSSLKLVNLVYRHGDRSPILIYPNDVNKMDKWPQGLGWLSKIGMQEHYSLGQWLQKRYMNDTQFMNSSYKREEISVLSSDEDRCLMSAYSNLAGLYPPSDAEKFDSDINWQPIPVFTKPAYEDNMLNLGAKCPKYDELLQQTLASHAVSEEEKQNKAFYKFIGEMTGWDDENITTIWKVADTTVCEKAHNLTVSSWINATVYDKLRELEAYQFTLMFKGQEQSMLKGGPLLNQFLLNMQDTVKLGSASKVKMYMYSGHDTTVAALLSALGVFDRKSPQYTATVIAELHQDPANKFFVNLFYKNETFGDTAYPLTLPGCEIDCPLDDFITLTKNSIPTNWKAQCQVGSGWSSSHMLQTGWIVAIALGSILILIIVISVLCFVRMRKKNDPFLYGKFEVSS